MTTAIAPYKRPCRDGVKNVADDEGTVVVFIVLRGKNGRARKGNVTKTLSIPDARVTDVRAIIDAALFGEQP